MTTKMCNTINQNIEQPLDTKIIEHIKRFGTLLNSSSIDKNNAVYLPQ